MQSKTKIKILESVGFTVQVCSDGAWCVSNSKRIGMSLCKATVKKATPASIIADYIQNAQAFSFQNGHYAGYNEGKRAVALGLDK